jgi:hypothetical protein
MNVPNQHQIDRLCEASTAQLRASVQRGENLQAAVAAFVADAHRTGMCPSEIVDYFCVSTPSMLDLAGVTGQQREDAVKALDESIARYLWH